jgi:phosphatidylglycerophosphate synthase
LQIETALIAAPSRANNRIFGRPLLERLLISCQRAGIRKFIIQAPRESRTDLDSALGGFKSHPDVVVVDNFDDAALRAGGVDTGAGAIAFSGNLVFQKSYLALLLTEAHENPDAVVRMTSADSDRGGEIAAGPIAKILAAGGMSLGAARPAVGDLPFALNGRPEDREEAELRLARSLRKETAHTDAPMARIVDRKISWRISYRLARTAVTPNQVTIANTLLGLVCALLFATPNYWARLVGALLFVASITFDGVDGELARLKMSETEFGGKLDVVTDNIVHVAIFVGIFTGVYRASHNDAFLYLMAVQLGGFGLAAVATYLAFSSRGSGAQRWIDAVDRWSGRDFAYLLVGFALLKRLDWFCWGTAFGTYIFAIALLWLNARRQRANTGNDGRAAA